MLIFYLFRLPEKYWNLKLPCKRPPVKEPLLLTALPLPGYLEQASFCFSILKEDFAMFISTQFISFLMQYKSYVYYGIIKLKNVYLQLRGFF